MKLETAGLNQNEERALGSLGEKREIDEKWQITDFVVVVVIDVFLPPFDVLLMP